MTANFNSILDCLSHRNRLLQLDKQIQIPSKQIESIFMLWRECVLRCYRSNEFQRSLKGDNKKICNTYPSMLLAAAIGRSRYGYCGELAAFYLRLCNNSFPVALFCVVNKENKDLNHAFLLFTEKKFDSKVALDFLGKNCDLREFFQKISGNTGIVVDPFFEIACLGSDLPPLFFDRLNKREINYLKEVLICDAKGEVFPVINQESERLFFLAQQKFRQLICKVYERWEVVMKKQPEKLEK